MKSTAEKTVEGDSKNESKPEEDSPNGNKLAKVGLALFDPIYGIGKALGAVAKAVDKVVDWFCGLF